METTRTLSRRQVLRLTGGAALAAIPALRLAGEVSAGRSWCRLDPTVLIDGEVVHLYVSGLLDQLYEVTGPTVVVFHVPTGVTYQLLEQDLGFGLGYEISFVENSKLKVDAKRLELTAEVYVPAVQTKDDLRVLVEWVPDGTVEVAAKQQGRTNEWITLNTKINR